MYYYEYLSITATAGKETKKTIVVSTAEERKKIESIYFTDNADLDLICYVRREKIVDIPTQLVSKNAEYPLPLARELKVGEEFDVGFRNRGAADITGQVAVKYSLY